MKNKKLLVIILALVLVLGGAGVLYSHLSNQGNNDISYGPEHTNEQEKNTTAAPTFTVMDSNGNKVSLQDFRGKPVVINFWATWCHFCVGEMPYFEESFQHYGDEIQFLMVNVHEPASTAQAFLEKNSYSLPVYYDTDESAYRAFGLRGGLPATFFIDADGNAVAKSLGALTPEMLQRGITMIHPQG